MIRGDVVDWPVAAHGQRWEPVGTILRATPGTSQRRVYIGYRQTSAWDHGAAGIFHHAKNCPGRELSNAWNGGEEENKQWEGTSPNPLNELLLFKHDGSPLLKI